MASQSMLLQFLLLSWSELHVLAVTQAYSGLAGWLA